MQYTEPNILTALEEGTFSFAYGISPLLFGLLVLLIIVGGLFALVLSSDLSLLGNLSKGFGFLAVLLAAVNIFGGFLVTQRMLAMYKKKPKKEDKE